MKINIETANNFNLIRKGLLLRKAACTQNYWYRSIETPEVADN